MQQGHELVPSVAMRMILRNADRRSLGAVTVEQGETPTKVRTDRGREVFLQWEGALDDGGHLRRCPACSGDSLYRHRRFPQVTGFIVVLALALGLASILGITSGLPLLIAMVLVLGLDVGILLLSPESLQCYRCCSSFMDTPIAPYHRRWDSETAAHHRIREPVQDSSDPEAHA
jgi:hypothetical protein